MGLYLFLHQLQVLFAIFPKKGFEKKKKNEKITEPLVKYTKK